jgi:outer membrane receptor for ferrienterochelin and colicin
MPRGGVTLAVAMLLAVAAGVAAQGNPSGAIRGQVLDPDNLPLPGVTVTAASPALQGPRTAVTSPNGDFIIPFLPPGEYSVTLVLPGFEPQQQTISVAIAETLPMKIKLALAGVTETVKVTGASSTEILKTVTVAETFRAASLERLPVGRTLTDIVLLAPGVAPNGVIHNILMSGALSYENLFLVNGATVNGNIGGQPLLLYIEDAIQETKVSTGSISAEYGRFQGGVVNMITKSGGNTFSGSFRTSLTNDAWRALTPDPADQTVHSLTPTFELTGGGPLRKDKVWFFGAGRFTKPTQNVTLDFTHVNYTLGTDDTRGEGKVTYALNLRNNLKASYTKRGLTTKNNSFGAVMDLASLYDDGTDFSLSVINYTSVLSDHVFLEGQYSKKLQVTTGTGSRYSDLVKGTPIQDRSRNQVRFNSPSYCNVCGGGWLEHQDNWDWFVKLSYFLSTRTAGSHSFVAGVDHYKEMRKNNNWQSGSSYTIEATTTIIDGQMIYPVFKNDNSTYVDYLPLVADSVGNDIRTYSTFVNDAWRYNTHLSLNLGFRYDLNRAKDQTGIPVVKDATLSPRLGVSWDIAGDGRWNVNAGFARYVTVLNTLLVDFASPGGRSANYSYFYQGPPVNTGSGPYVTADQALPILFNWFFANGGPNLATRNAPLIPGVNKKIGSDMKAPNSHEYSIGLAHDIGHHGTWRIDYAYRKYRDLYGDFVDATTGRVTDQTGRPYDVDVLKNNPDAKRTYKGVTGSVSYRLPSVQVGGNYTLSWSRGNVDGEGVNTTFYRTMIGTYPEYRQARWNSPMGYTINDQRHKVRAWLSYTVPGVEQLGQVNVGLLQRFDSALPYDASGPIVMSPNYVTNPPDYITPPSTVTYYFSPRFGLRWDNSWTTDLSVNWSKRIPQLGTTEVFFRGVITNLFNNSAVVSGSSTVQTKASPGSAQGLQPFNPFTETPVQGVNWVYGHGFGQPSGTSSYQAPRTFSCSAGIRF